METKAKRQFVRTQNPNQEQDLAIALAKALTKYAPKKPIQKGSFDAGLISLNKAR